MNQFTEKVSHKLPAQADICLVLTATIDPQGTSLTKRSDPIVRLEDYKKALRFWLEEKSVSKIVFCENSNYDIQELTLIEKKYNTQGKQVEFLSFYGQSFSKHLGKGYGEMMIISHVMNNSQILNETTKIIKVTGRYNVKNIARLVEYIQLNPNVDIISDLSENLSYADSRVFACSNTFLKQYLCPMQEYLDDSKGSFFEHILAIAIHKALSEGKSWSMPPCLPEILGVFGTDNIPYKRFFVKEAFKKILYKSKLYVFKMSMLF